MKKKIFIPIIIIGCLAVLFLIGKTMFLGESQNTQNEEENRFLAVVLEINEESVLVEPAGGEDELRSADQISFGTKNLPKLSVEIGSVVEVSYTGGIMESYPAQINATKWVLMRDVRDMEYTAEWLDKSVTPTEEDGVFEDIRITRIFANCFFGISQCSDKTEVKLNGLLPEEWEIGDRVICSYENAYFNEEKNRMEVDMLTLEESDYDASDVFGGAVAKKPVLYLYPEETMEVSVNLNLEGELTCTYPAYKDGWEVIASPDGTLVDSKGQTYNYLYWEGETNTKWDMTKGFCVKGEDTAAFLEEALDKLGLNRREANEFIVYWLPLMEQNPYNIISFQTDIYEEVAELEVVPKPDSLIRVFMAWQGADEYVEIPEQELNAPNRTGFTVVEWGGAEIE